MKAAMIQRSQHVTAAATFLLAMVAASAVDALTPLESLRYAPDITVVLGGTTVDHNEVAEDDLAGVVTLVNVGAIPSAAIVSAYDRLAGGDHLLSFDIDVALAGGLTARPGDVVRFDGAAFTLLFDAAAKGLPRGVITDAVSAIGPDDLLLSFDVTLALGAITATDRDVVRFHAGVFGLFVDGTAAGLSAGTDLDALHCIQQNGHLLMSFDITGIVGGVAFDDEDVLEYSPETDTWELAYDGLAAHAGWFGADLQALWAQTEPAAMVVAPMIGDPPPGSGDTNTIFPGSQRVSGRGTPRAKPGDTCIAIYDAGANGVPDMPPGSVDDILLGTGGTDAFGSFVATDESLGIPVMPPLLDGQRLFAVDVCAELTSGVFIVHFIGVPALTPGGLLAALVLLALLAGVQLRRVSKVSEPVADPVRWGPRRPRRRQGRRGR